MSEAHAKCFLPLSSSNHKGSSGRIGVLGGSARYTGAPYYAGMAALQTGADLVYVFCAQEAALAIKSYSPELMVAPVYTAAAFDKAATKVGQTASTVGTELADQMVQEVVSHLDRLHVLVIGPGLGRCPLVFEATGRIIQEAIDRDLALVLDADALYLLTVEGYKDILSNYGNVVLTPNVVEYKRLVQAHGDDSFLGIGKGAIIIKKGAEDVITQGGDDETPSLVCREEGGLKRSGGLGDILSGTVATFIGWHDILKSRDEEDGGRPTDRALSCWSACCVTKRATHTAFQMKRRAMTAPDVLNEIGPAMMVMEEDATELL
jgi:ATP-dependent NAD(P)H-hydrate dehydratase